MVAKQDFLPTFLLNFVVVGTSPPANERFLIAPAGEGQDPALPDVVDKSFDSFEIRPQHLCITKVRIPLFRAGMNFENH
jgi:hypothetical protein